MLFLVNPKGVKHCIKQTQVTQLSLAMLKDENIFFALEEQYNVGDIWNKIAAGKAIITLIRTISYSQFRLH